MKSTFFRSFAYLSAVFALPLSFVPAVALAIGPKDQKIPDPPTPLTLRATGLFTGKNGNIGTGTVVATKLDGTTGYVAILTAHHVASSQPTTLKLGSLIGGAASWLEFETLKHFRKYRYHDAQKNPKKLPVDIALVLGTVKNLTEGSQALDKWDELANYLPTVNNPTQGAGNPFLAATDKKPVGFTQLGYGKQGEYKGQIFVGDTIYTGYQATDTSGERLFQNNKVFEYLAPAIVKNPTTNEDVYYHPKVRFSAIGPPNNMGEGLGLAGDSGGPLFTMPPAAAVNIPVTRNGNNIQLPVQYTDSLSAVFVASQPVTVIEMIDGQPFKVQYEPETVSNNSSQFAVPINARIYKWMQPVLANPCIIPEPSTVALLIATLFAFDAVARRVFYNRR